MTDARTLTAALGGKWYRSYGLACCPAHGDKHPSLSIADGTDGRLLLSCKAGCSFIEVLDALRDRGLVGRDSRPQPASPAQLARRRAEEEAEAVKRESQALAVWREARPITGTLAEAYLRGRAITCPLPNTLRFHPDCWHPGAKRFPAMIALVEGGPRLAVHRTYLDPAGGKARLDPDKAMLGQCAGGAVRVAEAQGPLVVAEGIETAMSLSSGLLRGPATVWAALSTSGLRGLTLPPGPPGKLTVATDDDRPGREAGNALAARAAALGWAVSLLPAPDGRDWNDILTMKGAA